LNYKIADIEMDTSIQCRAEINIETVNEYAEAMSNGKKFPEVVLFGDKGKAWIGDGWHRIMAARNVGSGEINAELRKGGRVAALKHALSANASHGNRRTSADKRRCVELALAEFPRLSNVAIAEMCLVAVSTIARNRDDNLSKAQVARKRTSDNNNFSEDRRMGLDGKERPAHLGRKKEETKIEQPNNEKLKVGPPCMGMQHARVAILSLEEIRPNDVERQAAFDTVKGWIANAETKA